MCVFADKSNFLLGGVGLQQSAQLKGTPGARLPPFPPQGNVRSGPRAFFLFERIDADALPDEVVSVVIPKGEGWRRMGIRMGGGGMSLI